MSLDVLYHLIEDDIYENYLKELFNSSKKWVVIYSCNFDKEHTQHVKCRKFTTFVEKNFNHEWEQVKTIRNEYPYDEGDPDNISWSDFYFYKRKQ